MPMSKRGYKSIETDESSKRVEIEPPVVREDQATIPLRNRCAEIVAYAIVSKKHEENLTKTRWRLTAGYVIGPIDGHNVPMSRFVYQMEHPNELLDGKLIIYRDNSPLNISIENLLGG